MRDISHRFCGGQTVEAWREDRDFWRMHETGCCFNLSSMPHPTESRPETSPPPRASLALRLLTVVSGALLIWLAIGQLTEAAWGPDMSLPKHVANAVGTFVLAVPLVVVARRWLDRRSVATLGLEGAQPEWRSFLLGAATWLIPAAIGLTVCLWLGWLEIRIESSIGQLLGVIVLLTVLVFTYEAFPEELIFRGYIYRNLTAAMAPLLAIVVQALLFSAWGTTLWLVSAGWGVFAERAVLFFAMAFVIGCIRLMSGTVWAGIGFHVAFQVVMQLFLNSHYVDIEVSDEETFTLATAVAAFCTSAAIAGLFWRHTHNWRAREPDTAGPS